MWITKSASVFLALISPWQTGGPPSRHVGLLGASTNVSTYLESLRRRWEIKGVSIAVVQSPEFTSDGKWFRETEALGVRNDKGDRMKTDTLLSIASNSKLFTAVSAGLLVFNESIQPRLTWETKVEDVVPEWKLMDRVASRETNLIDLMSHRTGLPRHEFSYDSRTDASGLIRSMGHLRPSTGFRQAWQYQNLHYTTASHIVPSLTGVRFIDYVQKNIWDPMGMINSHYLISRARETGRLADGFVKVERNATECAHKMNGTDWSGVLRGQEVKVHRACLGETKSVGWFIAGDGEPHAGPGGVITCAEDMATWLQTLLLKGKSPQDGSVIIPEAILNDVSRGYTVPTGTSQWPEIGVMTYGMGQQRATYRGFEYIEHGGADTGQMSQVIRVPSKGIGIAIIVNDDAYGTAYHTVAKWRILDEMLGLEPINWEERLFKAQVLKVPYSVTPPSSKPKAPQGGFARLAATYHDAGYGNMTLCPLARTFPPNEKENLIVSDDCSRILEKQPFPVESFGGPTFISFVDKLWISYYAFSHFDGQQFNVSAATIWPDTDLVMFSAEQGESYDREVFAEFDKDGFGMGGGFWGAGPGIRNGDIGGKGVREGAEVYFMRL